MKKNRHTPEQLVRKLREAEAKLTAGAASEGSPTSFARTVARNSSPKP